MDRGRRGRLPAVALLGTALVTGCGDAGPTAAPTPVRSPSTVPGPTASPTPAPVPSPTPAALAQRCTHPTEGYSVGYPAGWHAADREGIRPCSFFAPAPLELEPATEADGVAVRLAVMDEPFETAQDKVRSDGTTAEAPATVGGQRAARFVGETTGEGLQPAGLATTTWLVDLGGRALLLTTDEAGTDDYAATVEVLDAMARSVEVG